MSSSIDFSLSRSTDSNKVIQFLTSLYDYMEYTFFWIKSTWVDDVTRNGLDYIGPSIIDNDIPKFKEILIAWKQLFTLATENFDVPLGYDFETSERYKERVNREKTIHLIDHLIGLCDLAIESNDTITVHGL
ncbi:hypothetical protein [Enterococcus sp.]|uniref:hypothetical protein n=1 Tax=Enterococcus sp. TaxID=35783 RepID=UPI002FC7C33F